ncbi:cytochrome c-type biogenesis protein CcmH [Dehalococcoidia bacterium]|nr:cytochrome c-type biogenesis protein CcmH [Dehalococcoidia bacterium]
MIRYVIAGEKLCDVASAQEIIRSMGRVGHFLGKEDHTGARNSIGPHHTSGIRFALCAFLASIALAGQACIGEASRDVPEIEQRAYSLNEAIMCPVCPGESIDQSQNPLAVQMRAIVIDKLTEGWSGQQIKHFFVERYGPSVLLAPPAEGISLTAWIVPPVAIFAAVIALLGALRWMRRSSDSEVATSVDARALTTWERERYFREIEAALELDELSDTRGEDESESVSN